MRSISAPSSVSTAALALVLSSTAGAWAQFAGNTGDGYTGGGLRHAKLDGETLAAAPFSTSNFQSTGDGYGYAGIRYYPLGGGSGASPAYTGTDSGADGYDLAGVIFRSVSGAAAPLVVFTAGNGSGDGYAASGLRMKALDGVILPAALYTSGLSGGDGYDLSGLQDVSPGGDASGLIAYRGNDAGGDGYASAGLRHSVFDGSVAVPVLYTGSSNGADGYDRSGLFHHSLDVTPVPAALYTGSETGGDGYDLERTVYLPLGGELAVATGYTGNTGDGYSLQGLRHGVLDTAGASPLAFAGGSADGYDRIGLAQVQFMGGGSPASGVTYASWINSRFSPPEIEAGLALPDSDADGDGLLNLMEFATGGDPRVTDSAFFGPQYRLSNLTEFGLPALPDHHLTALVRRNSLALDTSLTAEVTDAPEDLWSRNDVILVDQSGGLLLVRDSAGVSTAPLRFMRLRAELTGVQAAP